LGKIHIIGAGLTGICIAHFLSQEKKDIALYERSPHIGGLLKRGSISIDGQAHTFDLGGHIWHTKNKDLHEFVSSNCVLNNYIHKARAIPEFPSPTRGKYYPFIWPLNEAEINKHLDIQTVAKIQKELHVHSLYRGALPANFEEAAIDIFGPTLYRLFIYEYTKKMWGVEPKQLGTGWAPKRLKFNQDDRFFGNEYQGYPTGGWMSLLNNLLDKSLVKLYLETDFSLRNMNTKDTYIITGNVDEFIRGWEGKYNTSYEYLPYRTIAFMINTRREVLISLEKITRDTIVKYETTTLNYCYNEMIPLRVTNMSNFSPGEMVDTYVTDATLNVDMAKEERLEFRCYPMSQERDAYNRITQKIKDKNPNVFFAGRLGRYKYMNMDECIQDAMDVSVEVLKHC
jgi:UDP-galactopyranose mutase